MVTKEKQQEKALVPKTEKAVVKWKGEQITVSFHDVKTLICPYATDQETVVFLKTCQSLQLNPFANEIYLIKYSEEDKAAIVIDIHSYLKSAETNTSFNGIEAGIVLRDSGGKLEFREGSLLLPDEAEKLAGGYARVFRKDREKPFYMAVSKAECLRYTKSGNLTRFWTKEKQPMMLRKTALKRSLVEAFPSLFAGTLSTAEVSPDPEADYELAEGQLPPAFKKNGKTDWRKLYAKLRSELGVTPEQAHELVGAESFNDLLATGWAEDEIFSAVVAAHQQQKTAQKEPERVVDTQTGEIITQEDDLEKELFGEADKAGVTAPEEAHEDEEPTGAVAPAKPKRDPNSLKNANDLLKACNQDFKLQPKQVYAELNVSGPMEITDPSECFIRIAAIRSPNG